MSLADDATIARTLVMGFFDGNEEKTQLWFSSPNPQLGNITPIDMIELGRASKLLAFVQTSLAENGCN